MLTSTKNWVSNLPGVESKGVPGIEGSTKSAAAMVCEASNATTSGTLKPASAKRARMLSTVSNGSGISLSGDAATAIQLSAFLQEIRAHILTGWATEQELESWSTWAVADTDCTSKLDAIARNLNICRRVI